MQIASDTATKINHQDGHITDMAPYMINKLWGISYFSLKGPDSDARNYVSSLNILGYRRINQQDVIYMNVASFLLSGGTISLMKGAFTYISEDNASVAPVGITLDNIEVCWPEFTTYLNSDNVSANVFVDTVVGNNTYLRIGGEKAIMGKTRANWEFTLGIECAVGDFIPGLETTSNFKGFPFIKGSLSYKFTEHLLLGAEAFYGKGHTLREVREFPAGSGEAVFVKVKI